MTTPNNQPTPPPGMEIWKLAGTISDERLPEGAFYWNDSATYPRWEEAITTYPKDWLTYAIPIHPATGDAVGFIPKKERERLNKVIQNISEHAKPVEHRQELLPCPFCGKSSALSVEQNDEYSDEDLDDSDIFYRVICDFNDGGCGSSGGFKQPLEKAIALWNTRK